MRIIQIANISITFVNNRAIKYRESENSQCKLHQNFSIIQYRLVSSCYLHLRRLNFDCDLLPWQTRVNQRGKSNGFLSFSLLSSKYKSTIVLRYNRLLSASLKVAFVFRHYPQIAGKQSNAL